MGFSYTHQGFYGRGILGFDFKVATITRALFFTGFSTSKCKTAARSAVTRINPLRNKRQTVMRQMRRDIALLLQSGQDATARIRGFFFTHPAGSCVSSILSSQQLQVLQSTSYLSYPMN
ncbi:hypothetical protein L1987_06452 [Smallanthus sonchifolius]|uniref:Uncharacterized protein n=1 Tax=Smallanthus sonchifolius TaxID=185202 RepID=A0ACB9JYD4_9ASTR|nr:hypothetical protein L1987_06452 [Smallanthus sonchifolius]